MAVIYAVDLTAQATQVFGANGAITIDGLTWFAKGSLSAGALERGLLNGSGLYIGTVSGFTQPIIGTSANLTFPCFFLPLANVPDWDANKAYLVRGRFNSNHADNVTPLLGVVDTTSDGVDVQSTQRARDRLLGPINSLSSSNQLSYKLGTAAITTATHAVAALHNERVVGVYHLTPRFAAVGGEALASGMPGGLETWIPIETAPLKDYATVANPGVFFFGHFAGGAASLGATRSFLTHLQVELIGDVNTDSAPVIDNITPAQPGPLTKFQPLGFDLVDPLGAFVLRRLQIGFGAAPLVWEDVHDGVAFKGIYADSTETVISGGYRYSIVRAGGWPYGTQVRVSALVVDNNGNLVVIDA